MLKNKFSQTILKICLLWGLLELVYAVPAAEHIIEPISACVIKREIPLTTFLRQHIGECLGWQSDPNKLCGGYYRSDVISFLPYEDAVQIKADQVSFSPSGLSLLKGHVAIQQQQRIVSAQTASIYRDAKTGTVTHISLLGDVKFIEPGYLFYANEAQLNPTDKSGQIKQVLYRLDHTNRSAPPAWGRASLVERFTEQRYALYQATYSTCPPQDQSWKIEAQQIDFDQEKATGIARHAVLKVREVPILYAPYLTFPTDKERKSGFLMPVVGYSSVGGFDYAQPFYWNMAQNYDSTLTPHLYTRRGVMLGGDFRFLTPNSNGVISGHFLPNDHAFENFLQSNINQYPQLRGVSDNRWSTFIQENTQLADRLRLNINFQKVSDDYYLQDFSNNFAVLTENQLLRQGTLSYYTDHWLFHGKLQSYQTLHPINQSAISNIYERLPQLLAYGNYQELPMNGQLTFLSQLDDFHWPGPLPLAQGPRYHFSPDLTFTQSAPWGFVKPEVELIENYYTLNHDFNLEQHDLNRTIPRYGLEGGLFFEKNLNVDSTQTLEPRGYYLFVPYHDQAQVPVFDSAYMIFNYDQLFRKNRFSGFDRIGDTNQLSYALASRWLYQGQEKASVSLGQVRYFSPRRVQLCHNPLTPCYDSPLILGYLSPRAAYSPVASRAMYHWNAVFGTSADYVWDGATQATNNADVNFHYNPGINRILNFGYSYLINGNVTEMQQVGIKSAPLHQANVSYSLPLNERWSHFGAYTYNLSRGYDMMTLLGLQYESCCWAFRFMGGRAFQSLEPGALTPRYNNNVYLQILLKGLGSVASHDPSNTIQTYLPGYHDIFH